MTDKKITRIMEITLVVIIVIIIAAFAVCVAILCFGNQTVKS